MHAEYRSERSGWYAGSVGLVLGAFVLLLVGQVSGLGAVVAVGGLAIAIVIGALALDLRDERRLGEPHVVRLRRIRGDRFGRAGWGDLAAGVGIVFLILAVIVFALLVLAPVGVSTPSGWGEGLGAVAGAFGLILIEIGLLERGGKFFGRR